MCYTKVVHLHGFFLLIKCRTLSIFLYFKWSFLSTLLTTMKETKIKLGICFPTYNISSSVNNEVCSLHQWPFQSKTFDLFQINFLYGNKLLIYMSNIKKRSILISIMQVFKLHCRNALNTINFLLNYFNKINLKYSILI